MGVRILLSLARSTLQGGMYMKKLLTIITGAIFGIGLFSASANASTLVNTDGLTIQQATGIHAPIKNTFTYEQPMQTLQRASGNEKRTIQAQPEVKAATELQVVATAYCASEAGNSDLTAAGYDITKNPSMKLIAVDPKVIPLGTKVWVEGYGEAIAGDTGGKIKGNRIDVLMPSINQANQWGRKTVTVRILQ